MAKNIVAAGLADHCEVQAAYGHFGRDDLDVPWEKTNMAETLKKKAGMC